MKSTSTRQVWVSMRTSRNGDVLAAVHAVHVPNIDIEQATVGMHAYFKDSWRARSYEFCACASDAWYYVPDAHDVDRHEKKTDVPHRSHKMRILLTQVRFPDLLVVFCLADPKTYAAAQLGSKMINQAKTDEEAAISERARAVSHWCMFRQRVHAHTQSCMPNLGVLQSTPQILFPKLK